MKVVTSYPDGMFNWIDLSTSDTGGAKTFYTGLFGWEANDVPTDQGTDYTMLTLEGNTVAGLGPMDPNMQAQGMPPVWTSYVKHDNVDAIAAKAAEAGGTVILPPMDVMEEGRMTMIQDPTGAVFGVWQPKNHIGAQLVNHPNTLVWNELQTRDTEAARDFYDKVFDWDYTFDEKNNYLMCQQDNRVQAGILEMDDSWGDIPPNWAVYFLVDDVAATLEKAEALGGTVIAPKTAVGEMGHLGIISDPQGGTFAVMEFKEGRVDNPPGH